MLSRFRIVGACILCAALFVATLLFVDSPDYTSIQGRMANESSFTVDARFGGGQERGRAVKEGRDVKHPSRRATAALLRSERQQKRAYKRFERKLASPAWKRERQRSRIAFRDLAPSKALTAVADQHEQLIARPTATDLSLRKAEKLVAYESPTQAKVELANGKLALVESVNVPLATPADGPGGKGPLVPVQLGLLDRGASWSPKTPAVATTLPKQASVNATLGDRLALALPNKRGAGTLVDEAKVFYANQLTDTDVVLEPRNAGLEISWVLRSPESPSLLPLDLKGRKGEALKFKLDETGKVSAAAGDRTVAQISPLFIWDAQGRSVRGEYVVGPDGQLSVSVDHAKQDLAYPLVVDPLVREWWQEAGYNTPAMREDGDGGRAGWVFSDYAGQANVFFKSWYYEPWLGISMAAGVPGGYARWTFGPLRESAIFRVTFLNFQRDTGSAITTLGLLYGQNFNNASLFHVVETAQGTYSGNGAWSRDWEHQPANVTICSWYPTCSYGGVKGSQAVFEMSGNGSNRAHAVGAKVDGALVYHRENDPPVIQSIGFFQAPQNGWFRAPRLRAQLQLNDAGIGFCDDGNLVDPALASHPLTVTDHNAAQTTNFGWQYEGGCTGSATYAPAPTQINPIWTEGEHAGGNTTMIPEGIRTLRFTARDMFGNAAIHTESVQIDRSAPRVTVGGRLGAYVSERAGVTGPLPADIRTYTGSTDLTVAIQDSKPGIYTSGVNLSKATVQPLDDAGNRVGVPTSLFTSAPSCSSWDDCDRPGERVAPSKFDALPPGLYQVEVDTTDRAGNNVVAAYVFAKGGGEITTVVEGQGTARWVPLQAKRTTGSPTQATFQWRTGSRGWQNVPGNALQAESDSSVVGSPTVAMSAGLTGRYVLDVEELIKRVNEGESSFIDLVDGRIQVRAEFNGTGGSIYDRKSEDVAVRLDRGGRDTSDITTELGGGTVDLLTGNFSLTSTDASVDGYKSSVSLTRAYSSRYVSRINGERFSDKEDGPLGPGWALSLPADGASDFVRAVDLDDPARDAFWDRMNPGDADLYDPAALPEERWGAVRLEMQDGSGFVFERRESDGAYVPEAGFERYGLSRVSSNGGLQTERFVLTDRDASTKTTFGARLDDPLRPHYDGTPEHGTFGVTSVDADGVAGKPQWQYVRMGDLSRDAKGNPIDKNVQWLPTRVTAAHDGSIACPTEGSLPEGCRSLDLTYERRGNPSRFRLTQVSMSATDPDTRTVRSEVVASYEYSGDAARLSRATDRKSDLAFQYGYDSDGLLSTITPPGEAPYSISYQSHIDDKTKGRVRTTSRDGATWTVLFSDRTLGGATPWNMGPTDVDDWGQAVTPFRATAILPPDVPFALDKLTLQKANISYLDALGRQINHAAPGGRISSTDYDKWGNVTRSLSPAGRAAALAVGAGSSDAANRRATFTYYEDDSRGSRRPVRVVGPERTVRLSSGVVVGRSLTLTRYDEKVSGEPFDVQDVKMPYNLPTVVRTGAVTNASPVGLGGTEEAMRVSRTEFDLASRQPLRIIRDAGGPLESTERVVYDTDGKEIERRQPKDPGTSSPNSADVPTTTKTTYYASAGARSATTCGGRPEWVGLPCTVESAGSEPTAGLRKLPAKRFFYDFWRRPKKVVETATTSTGAVEVRTTETTFDGKGRPKDELLTPSGAGVGVEIQKVRHIYSETTGREVETQQLTGADSLIRRISRTYDSLGRITTYADSSAESTNVGAREVTTYDQLSRPQQVTQWLPGGASPIATKIYGYDPATGYLTSLKDSGLDPSVAMSAEYDLDGRPTSVTYPSGLAKFLTYEPDGSLRRVEYKKGGAVWYSDEVARSAHNQIIDDVSTLSTRRYAYDELGRLTSAGEKIGTTCATRTYSYDQNSNRLSKSSATGAVLPGCSPVGSASQVTSTYDSSDRLASTSGYGLGAASPTYDAWGRIKLLPKQASNGGLSVETNYFVNDKAASIKNGSVTVTNTLDPMDRVLTRSTQTTGQSTVPFETFAYGDDGDSPMFTRSSTAAAPTTFTGWTRYVEDPTGELAAQLSNVAGSAKMQFSNVRGDIVAEASAASSAAGLSATFAVDEFGVPTGTSMGQRKWGFVGSKQRESLLYGSVVAMGARVYSPWSGRFLQLDPVRGGSANVYDYANQDPINSYDLDGRATQGPKIWRVTEKVPVYEAVYRNKVRVGRVKVGTVTQSYEVRIDGNFAIVTASAKFRGKRGIKLVQQNVKCRQDRANRPDGNCGAYSKAGGVFDMTNSEGKFFFEFSWYTTGNGVPTSAPYKKQTARMKCSGDANDVGGGCNFE